MQVKKELSIVIVNYNKYELTQRCIESVISTVLDIKYEIIVVDNCSSNESYKQLKQMNEKYEEVNIIANSQNRGFGYGNNTGVDLCKYNNILLLNPDVVVLENAISKMLDRILGDESIGIIGSKLLNEDLTLQYSCRRFLPLHKFILARTPFKRFIKKSIVETINSKYLMKDYDHKEEKEVDWLMGSCLMLRKKDFLDVGGFSKEYFMYFEDVDLCYKLRKAGKRVLYYPEANMIHLHEQASVKRINKLTFIHLQSMIKFYIKFDF